MAKLGVAGWLSVVAALAAWGCSEGTQDRGSVAEAQAESPEEEMTDTGASDDPGGAADDNDNQPGAASAEESETPSDDTRGNGDTEEGEDDNPEPAVTQPPTGELPTDPEPDPPPADEGDGTVSPSDEPPEPRPEPTPDPESDPDAGSSGECAPKECGDPPLLVSLICADGSPANPTCSRDADGNCSWQAGQCLEPVGESDPPKEASADELACETDQDCTACDSGPAEKGDCVCPACPAYPVNVEACRARQAIFLECAPVVLCPQVLCTLPPAVGCVDGQCVVTGEADLR